MLFVKTQFSHLTLSIWWQSALAHRLVAWESSKHWQEKNCSENQWFMKVIALVWIIKENNLSWTEKLFPFRVSSCLDYNSNTVHLTTTKLGTIRNNSFLKTATRLEPRTIKFVNEQSTIWPNWPNDRAVFWELICTVHLAVCSCHITYAFQSVFTLYSCLNVKELPAQSRREIWSISDCNWTRTRNNGVWIHSETRAWHDKSIQLVF